MVSIVCALLATFTVHAEAADLTTINQDGNGAYTVTRSGLQSGEQAVLLVVRDKALGADGALPAELAEGDITYIDQATADADGSVTFAGFIPKQLPDSTVFVTAESLPAPLAVGHIEGFGVAGKILVRSYDPKKPITATLYEAGTTIAVDVFTLDAAASGAGQQILPFAFENILDGDYDLVVSKPGHVSFKITGIKVDGEDIDLTAHSNPEIRTIVLPAGNLTGDSWVNSSDLSDLIAGLNYDKTTENAANKNADVNGDGYVNSSDLSIVIAAENYGKTVKTVDYAN
jgi:hypothetical protein